MPKKTYTDHYKDSRWQQKRLEIMERDKWTCRSCGAKGEGVTLNVHHAYYEKGKKPWEYDNYMLVTWCEDCHEERHRWDKTIRKAMARLPKEAYNGLYILMEVMWPNPVLKAIANCHYLGDTHIAMLIKLGTKIHRSGAEDFEAYDMCKDCEANK